MNTGKDREIEFCLDGEIERRMANYVDREGWKDGETAHLEIVNDGGVHSWGGGLWEGQTNGLKGKMKGKCILRIDRWKDGWKIGHLEG